MIRTILQRPSPLLLQKAENVTRFNEELKLLIRDMYETMDSAQGVGLAANQIGDPRDVFVLDAGEGRQVYINAKIVSKNGNFIEPEGCLSVPGVFEGVKRFKYLTVEFQDENGTYYLKTVDGGLMSKAIQHETDHLAGKLFLSHLSPLKREIALKRSNKSLKQNKIQDKLSRKQTD